MTDTRFFSEDITAIIVYLLYGFFIKAVFSMELSTLKFKYRDIFVKKININTNFVLKYFFYHYILYITGCQMN